MVTSSHVGANGGRDVANLVEYVEGTSIEVVRPGYVLSASWLTCSTASTGGSEGSRGGTPRR